MSRYDDWMRRQSPEFQDDVLGARQARLFRKGRLVLHRYRSRAGDALSVQQMRERDALVEKQEKEDSNVC